MQEAHAHHGQAGHSEVLHVLAALSSVAITYAGLAFLYKVLPNARVRLRSALTAAFVAGTAWELAKFGFAELSARMVQVHKIYGSVAVLPIVLTWVYISWFITLTGCRLCFAMDASKKPEPSPLLLAAQVREAARSSLGFPRWEADAVGEALLQAWQRAEGAAAGALGEPLSDFLQRVEPAGQRPAPSALSAVPGPQEDEGRQPAATARKPVSV